MDLSLLYGKFNEYKAKKIQAEQDLKSEDEKIKMIAQLEFDMASSMTKQLGAIIIDLTSSNDYVKKMQQIETNKNQVVTEKEAVMAQYDQKIVSLDTQISACAEQSKEAEIYLAVKSFM